MKRHFVARPGSIAAATKYQTYWNDTIYVEAPDGQRASYIGKRHDDRCFDNEADAERYCYTHVGLQKLPGGDYVENDMSYDEIEASENSNVDGWVVYAHDNDTGVDYVAGVYDSESYAHYWAVMDKSSDAEYGYGDFTYSVKYVPEVTDEMWDNSFKFSKLKLDNNQKFLADEHARTGTTGRVEEATGITASIRSNTKYEVHYVLQDGSEDIDVNSDKIEAVEWAKEAVREGQCESVYIYQCQGDKRKLIFDSAASHRDAEGFQDYEIHQDMWGYDQGKITDKIYRAKSGTDAVKMYIEETGDDVAGLFAMPVGDAEISNAEWERREADLHPSRPVELTTTIKASSDIANLQDRIAEIKDKLADPNIDADKSVDLQMELQDLEEQLNFAWQDDEADYNYALEQQEFNPDGSLKGYHDSIESATDADSTRWVMKIIYENEGIDSMWGGMPTAGEEIIEVVADNLGQAEERAAAAWGRPYERIEVAEISPYYDPEYDDDLPVESCSITAASYPNTTFTLELEYNDGLDPVEEETIYMSEEEAEAAAKEKLASDPNISYISMMYHDSVGSGFNTSIYRDEDAVDPWSVFRGKQFLIMASKTNEYGELLDRPTSIRTDDPKKALEAWFKYSPKAPMEAAIFVKTKSDGVTLCEAATEEVCTELYNKYPGNPYELSYLVEGAGKTVANGGKYIYESEYGDQVFPFCYG